MIERLDQIDELVPDLAARVASEILDEPNLGVLIEQAEAGYLVRRVNGKASSESLKAWRESGNNATETAYGRLSLEQFDQLRRYREAIEEQLVDEINLTIERLQDADA